VKAAGIPCRFVTNTSTLARESLCRTLRALGFRVEASEIFSAPRAALRHLKQRPGSACHLVLAEDVRREFGEVVQTTLDKAAYIVLGDIGEAWSYELLNRIFNRLMEGAQLIVIHRNRFWQTGEGLRMDIGGFVAALEYCSGTKALVVGKPAPEFFRLAVEDMGLAVQETMIVGDDIDADIGGGQAAGLVGTLVRTGKYRRDYVAASSVRPDHVIDSVRDLPALLGIEPGRRA
jgi:HAD superfamily hydrolase (TIGR01458 family)